tara:strand:- start:1621 stop:1776 length:156 start_codon:yes stop_codon:yes gene_type:complete
MSMGDGDLHYDGISRLISTMALEKREKLLSVPCRGCRRAKNRNLTLVSNST